MSHIIAACMHCPQSILMQAQIDGQSYLLDRQSTCVMSAFACLQYSALSCPFWLAQPPADYGDDDCHEGLPCHAAESMTCSGCSSSGKLLAVVCLTLSQQPCDPVHFLAGHISRNGGSPRHIQSQLCSAATSYAWRFGWAGQHYLLACCRRCWIRLHLLGTAACVFRV